MCSGSVEHAASSATASASTDARLRANRVTRRPPGTHPCADEARRNDRRGPARAAGRTRSRRNRREGTDCRRAPRRIETGSVGTPRSRNARALQRAPRQRADCRGSTVCANAQLATVYSWPQQTSVSPGNAARRSSDASICSGVPSKMRPQPTLKSVSPQNTMPCPWYAMCVRVWPGTPITSKRSAGCASSTRSPSATRCAARSDALVVRRVDRDAAGRR